MNDKRLTQAELAARLRKSVRQIQRLEALGMPSIPTGRRGKVYDPVACEQWLIANRATLCPTEKTPPVGGTSSFASSVAAFTASCRRAQLRLTPSASTPNSASP